MKKLKKGVLRLLAFSAMAMVALGVVLFFFFYRTEAPVTKGKVEFHVPYKPLSTKEGLTLDIYHPTGALTSSQYPVLMYIHGGAWIAGSKLTVNNNRFNRAFNALRAEGYFIISPDYTLAENGKSPFPDCIEDVFTAMQWIEENAATYRFDMDRIGVIGESAGGHLAMIMCYSEPADFGLTYEKPQINFLIDVYGPTDLNALYHAATTDSINDLINRLPASLAERLDLSRLLVGFDPDLYPEKAADVMEELSPLSYLDHENIPTLILHGKQDQIVPLEQSRALTRKLDSLDYRYEAHYFEGVNHAFAGATNAQKEQVQQLIIDFVLKQNQNL